MRELFAQTEQEEYLKVIHDTWGHLAPKDNHVYWFKAQVAVTDWGETTVISVNWSDDLPNSPWEYSTLGDIAFETLTKNNKPTGVYLITGWVDWDGEGNFDWSSDSSKILDTLDPDDIKRL